MVDSAAKSRGVSAQIRSDSAPTSKTESTQKRLQAVATQIVPQIRPPLPLDLLYSIAEELQGDLTTLARIARVSKTALSIMDPYLYKNVAIPDADALLSFQDALRRTNHVERAKTVRSLKIIWRTSTSTTPPIATRLAWILRRLAHLEHLDVLIPDADLSAPSGSERTLPDILHGESRIPRHETLRTRIRPLFAQRGWTEDLLPLIDGPAFFRTLRTLDTTFTFLRPLSRPVPTLTNLSVNFEFEMQSDVCAKVSQLFGEGLQRLRLRRSFRELCLQDSVLRLCAGLKLPKLGYLEVLDTSVEGFPFGRVDSVYDTHIAMNSIEHMTALERIFWAPAWRGGAKFKYDSREGLAYGDSLTWYMNDVLDTLSLPELFVAMKDKQSMKAWKMANGKYDADIVAHEDQETWWCPEPRRAEE